MAFRIDTLAAAAEARRCLAALERIEDAMIFHFGEMASEIASERPDLADVTRHLAGGLRDLWDDSGAPALRADLEDALARYRCQTRTSGR